MSEPSAHPASGRQLGAETLGAAVLAFVIVAAGILGERFAGGNTALAMLMTCIAGSVAFAVLSWRLRDEARAMFNPAIVLALLLRGRLALIPAALTAAVQMAGAFLGAITAHIVTNMAAVQVASQLQTGLGVWTGEFLASALFALTILTSGARAALAGGGCLLAISLATPSLSFANPALTFARSLTDSFTAIRLEDGAIIAALQLGGALAAFVVLRILRSAPTTQET